MNGKRIKVNDFKFKYGQETIFINVFGAFKYKKNNNKYVIYSYDNSKLYYGSLFIRDNELVIMLTINNAKNIPDIDILFFFLFSLTTSEAFFFGIVNSSSLLISIFLLITPSSII